MASQGGRGARGKVRAAAGLGRREPSGKDVCACVCTCVPAYVCVCMRVCSGALRAASVRLGKVVERQKAKTVLTQLVSYLSLLLPADAHAEFYCRNKLVSTRLLNCSHLAVPTRLGVNAGSIVSLPDTAEQHKHDNL